MNPDPPRQNRVDPWGRLIANPARGSLMGNRGALHDDRGRIRRDHAGKRWIICLLEFKGRHRQVMTPGQYTELFFLDEATALAAGHRPCAECQRPRYNEFRAAWAEGNSAAKLPSAVELDDALHPERVGTNGSKPRFRSGPLELPDGTFVAGVNSCGDATPHLLWEERLWPWRPSGYGESVPVPVGRAVDVLTPRSTVNALAAGFQPAEFTPSG